MAAVQYAALRGWFELTPFIERQHNPLYLTGESYAGQYVPNIASWIVEHEGALRAQEMPHTTSKGCAARARGRRAERVRLRAPGLRYLEHEVAGGALGRFAGRAASDFLRGWAAGIASAPNDALLVRALGERVEPPREPMIEASLWR